MYNHRAPTRPATMLMNPEVTFPITDFGVSHPNENFRPATKSDSLPDPSAGGLLAKDALVLSLANLQPENELQKERRGILLGELAEVLEQIEALTTEVNTQRHSRLTEEHRLIRSEGRKAETRLQRCSDAYTAADIFALNMIEVQSQARQNLERLHDMEERGVHLKRFHSDQELADWRQKYSEYQDLAKAGAQMATEAVAERKRAADELQAAREEVGRLAAIEGRIRAELKGLPIWDSELGLGEPGASRMTPELASTMARRD